MSKNLKSFHTLNYGQHRRLAMMVCCCTHTPLRPKCNFSSHSNEPKQNNQPFQNVCVSVLARICACVSTKHSCRMNNARVCCLYCVSLFTWFTITFVLRVCVCVCLRECHCLWIFNIFIYICIEHTVHIHINWMLIVSWIPIDEYPIKISADSIKYQTHICKCHVKV